MSARMLRYPLAVIVGLAAAVALAPSSATAQPAPADPAGPSATSTTDELADMVMDVVEHGGPPMPTTTPVPAPPG